MMQDFSDAAVNEVISAYSKPGSRTLTEQLLFAILARLDKISRQLEREEPDDES